MLRQCNTWPSLVLLRLQVMVVGTRKGITRGGAAGETDDAEVTMATTDRVKAAPHLLTTSLHKVGVLAVAKVPINRQGVSTPPLPTQ